MWQSRELGRAGAPDCQPLPDERLWTLTADCWLREVGNPFTVQPRLAELSGFSSDIAVTDRDHPLSLGGPHSSLGCHPAQGPQTV